MHHVCIVNLYNIPTLFELVYTMEIYSYKYVEDYCVFINNFIFYIYPSLIVYGVHLYII